MAQKQVRLNPQDIGNARPDQQPKGEFERILAHVAQNPLLYLAGVGFVALCLLAGILFRLSSEAAEREVMTSYAGALATEDPAVRLVELEKIAQEGGRWGQEALYLSGEAAIQAGELDRAREIFQRVLDEHGNTEYAPRAAEGLAWIAENQGEYQQALEAYQAVEQDYPGTFVARIQPFNIGRMHEELEQWQAAADAYKRQQEVFPDSVIAGKAQAALDTLAEAHPEVAPAPEVAEEPAATPEGAPTAEAAEVPAATPAETIDTTVEPAATAPEPVEAAPAMTEAPAPPAADDAAAPGTPEAAVPAAETGEIAGDTAAAENDGRAEENLLPSDDVAAEAGSAPTASEENEATEETGEAAP